MTAATLLVAFVLAILPLSAAQGQNQAYQSPETTTLENQTPPGKTSSDVMLFESTTIADAMDEWIGKFGEVVRLRSAYSATWYPSSAVSGQASEIQVFRHALTLNAPIWRKGGDGLNLNLSGRNYLFSSDAFLPDTGRPFPDELWSLNMGLGYIHQFDRGRIGGLSANLGSASDKPFSSTDEMAVGLSAFLRVPARNNRDWWRFSIAYSPLSDMRFPIPMVSYRWNRSEDLRIDIGLPFSLMWRPAENLTVHVSYFPVYNLKGHVMYRLIDRIQVFGGYEVRRESFYLADRADTDDRFVTSEQRVIGGVRWDVSRHASFDLNGGYAFDRYYGEGATRRGSLHDRIDIDSGGFAGTALRIRF